MKELEISKKELKKRKLQLATKNFYDKHNYPDGSDGRYEYFIEKLSKYINLKNLKGKKVLDVGCGTGTISNILYEFGADVYAFDQSINSVNSVKKNYPNIKVKQGDALNNPFKDDEFDLVVSIGVLHHTPNCYKGFQECARVTKPGGHMLILLYRKWHWYPILYHLISPFCIGRNANNLPKWFLFPIKKFIDIYYGETTTYQDVKDLFADQYYTPQATFHSKNQINKWGKKNNLKLLKTGTQYLWQHGLYYLEKLHKTNEKSINITGE